MLLIAEGGKDGGRASVCVFETILLSIIVCNFVTACTQDSEHVHLTVT